uniref:6-phosphofructo-2-kinase domain-containing protein n=1 Tax=Ditylum brightwellii TaxID=49249 RepID=A0A7S4WAX8_9STRA|mmetsp:Transcript_6065/g.7909  ORF Transcript_6065/g.7909 Transcript_6065/m.7909 type:complete len:495 (+) Transcript_6065:391-1875(+)
MAYEKPGSEKVSTENGTQQKGPNRSAIRTFSTKSNISNPHNVFQEQLVIAMVGLPARGKSYLSKATARYLNFAGCPCRLFNAGNLRREQGLAGTDAAFFDQNNAEAKEMREILAMKCLRQLLDWVQHSNKGCRVGILDATNTTSERRRNVIAQVRVEAKLNPRLQLIFVESLADDPELLENNYRMKLSNDDYKGKDPIKALADFKERVRKYEAVYEEVCDYEDNDIRYIKLINAGEKLVARKIHGFVPRRLLNFLGCVHLWPRTIWIALSGETDYDLAQVLGGDPSLTEEGQEYALGVSNLIQQRIQLEEEPLRAENGRGSFVIYTGTHKRYIQMVETISQNLQHHMKGICPAVLAAANANDLCEGLLDSTTEAQRKELYPLESEARRANKLNYRYPGVGGESYQDLVGRCNELCGMLEHSRGNSLVICNRAVYRVVTAYFLGKAIEEIPFLEVKPGVLELRRNHSGFYQTQLEVNMGKCTSAVGVGSTIESFD